MKKFLLILVLFFTVSVRADDVILMIGDGMGANHLKCAAMDQPLFITSLPVKGMVHTYSANSKVTDSAAAATAFACGQKTNNHFVGKLPDKTDCVTLAEEAVEKNYAVGIYSNDVSTGATPAAFFAHTTDRLNRRVIEAYKIKASRTMDIAAPVNKISDEVDVRLDKLSNKSDKGFFAVFEGAKIDKASHINELNTMKQEVYDFDEAVKKAYNFVDNHPNATLVVLADHETGGLTESCQYTTHNHTGQDIPVYAFGKHADLFMGNQENTAIHDKIKQILFTE